MGAFELQGTDVGHTTVARAFIWTAHGTYSNAVVCWEQSGARREWVTLMDPDRTRRREGRAVSPVVAVVLMLAITVMLMATVVPLVLGQSAQVTDPAPDAQLAFVYTEDVDMGDRDDLERTGNDVDADGKITVRFESGESVLADELNLTGTASAGKPVEDGIFVEGERLSPGSDITVWANRGDTLRVVWDDPGRDRGSVLGSFTVRPTE